MSEETQGTQTVFRYAGSNVYSYVYCIAISCTGGWERGYLWKSVYNARACVHIQHDAGMHEGDVHPSHNMPPKSCITVYHGTYPM